MTNKVSVISFHPGPFSSRSGMNPLAEALGADMIGFKRWHKILSQKHWRLGEGLRHFGNWYYGSSWNALVPIVDDVRIAGLIARQHPSVVHYLWAEFACPGRVFHVKKPGRPVIGTFHCSARRFPSVLSRYRLFHRFDHITLMSETQRSYLLDRGVAPDKISVILHGVDTNYFRPDETQVRDADQPLQAILVGATERDHEFAAEVLKKLPAGVMQLKVLTQAPHKNTYQNLGNATLLPRLKDDDLLKVYQSADLLFMPMLDCTANNVFLESMACGTPVMTNRVGGVPEYICPEGNIIMDDKNADDWVDMLLALAKNREPLQNARITARNWAEQFDWSRIAGQYRNIYRRLLDESTLAT